MTIPASGEGTPDRPAFARRRALFVVLLVLYVVWVGVMIVWSAQLKRS